LMDICQTILNLAQTMTFRGLHPVVKRIHKTYHTGVKLTQKQMTILEQRFQRLEDLAKWFVRITPFYNADCSDIFLE